MEQTPGVTAVVVTYDRAELLMQCLDALQAQTVACDILVVDNASTDDTGPRVRRRAEKEPRLQYHNMGRNTGGAGGFHCGVRRAMQAGCRYIWLMDDDCQPEPDALEQLLQADRLLGGAEGYGFLSSAALWTDGQECLMNRQKPMKGRTLPAELAAAGLVRVEQATFVSLFVPARTVRQVGLPIKEYFIWGDDIEYTRRIAIRHRMPCYLVGESRVLHKTAGNSGSNIAIDDTARLDRYRLAFRNESFTYRQEGPLGTARYLYRCLRSLWWILRDAKTHRGARIKTLLQGMRQGLRFAPEIEKI